jgi:hypothetical protein
MESSKECGYVDMDHEKAKVAFEKGCLANDADACLSLAQYFEIKEKDKTKAAQIYGDFCDEKNQVACDMLAAMEVKTQSTALKKVKIEVYQNTEKCNEFKPIYFEKIVEDIEIGDKLYKNYEYYKSRLGDYELLAGDMPVIIKNTKLDKECEANVPGIVWPRYKTTRVVFKADCDDFFFMILIVEVKAG